MTVVDPIATAAAWSWEVTERVAWPALCATVGGGYLIRELDQATDMSRRIDGYWIHTSGRRTPLAVRCQDGFGSEYETFTVRDSEYAGLSRVPAMLGPRHHLQSYVTADHTRLLSAALAESWEVLAYVDMNQARPGFWRTGPDHSFAVVPWRHLSTAVIVGGNS